MIGDDPTECPFCDYEGPSEILDSSPMSYVIEPIDPVTEGHLLVIPYAHFRDFTTEPTLTALVMSDAAKYAKAYGGAYNLITSKGSFATQTVAHLHFHLVPRREDDGLLLPWG